jgi:hypothetical protein
LIVALETELRPNKQQSRRSKAANDKHHSPNVSVTRRDPTPPDRDHIRVLGRKGPIARAFVRFSWAYE